MNTGEKVLAHLQAYDLKPDGGPGKWRCNSPLRPGANSHSFTLKIEADGERGVYDDHAGGQGGTLYQLADALGIDHPKAGKRQAVDNSKRAYKNLAEYAKLKGVPEQAFVNAGWAAELTTYDKRPAIAFKTAGGLRYRFVDGQSPAFKSQQGYKACWYGIKQAAALAKQQNTPLVICNGEPSVVVAFHYRVPACAITGGEQPTILDALLQELKSTWTGAIILAMDCDDAGRKAAAGKAKILRAAGFSVAVVDLQLGDKGDLADLCKLYTDQTTAHLLELAQEADQPPQVASPELAAVLKDLTAARRQNAPQATIAQLLDKAQAEIDHSRIAAQPQMIQRSSKLVDVRHKRLDAARANPSPIQGLRCGIDRLDAIIGGFQPGRVYTFYGDTGSGKSTTLATIACALLGQAPGLIIPTESMPGDWLDKMAAYKANVPFDAIETGMLSNPEYHAVTAAYNWLESHPLSFLDSLAPTIAAIGTAARDGVKNDGLQWVVIDSVNNLASVTHDDVYGKTSEAADFTQELARMGLIVLQTSQVGRNMKDRKNKIPQLTDALGSGRIEQNSDVVMAGYNHQYYVERELAKPDDKFPPGMLFYRCLKHRWRGSQSGKGTFVTFKGGVGIFG